MKSPKNFACVAVVCSILCVGTVLGQNAQQDAVADSIFKGQGETRIFQLKNVSVYDAHEVVRTIFRTGQVSIVERINSLVVRHSPETLDQIDQLLTQMESQKPIKSHSEVPAMVIPLKYRRDAGHIAEMLQMIYNANIIADDDGQQLLVSGEGADVMEVARMVSELDRPERRSPRNVAAKTLSVTIDFVLATSGATKEGGLPDYLKTVEVELLSSGLGNLQLFGHLMARTRENEHFESKGFVTLGLKDKPVSFIRVSGSATLVDQQALIDVEAVINSPVPRQQKSLGGELETNYVYEDFGLSTTAGVPLGDYLVLGAVPTCIEQSDTILMIVHVTGQ